MDEEIYQLTITHSKENLFKDYLSYLNDLNELTKEEIDFYQREEAGRNFLNLIENTSTSKVYKMTVLRAFYNDGKIRMEISEEEVLKSWKQFFSTGTNWKDFASDMTYQKYLAISDKTHLKKILQMPVYYLEGKRLNAYVRKSGDLYIIRFENGGGIQVKRHRLFMSPEEAEVKIGLQINKRVKKIEGFRSPYDYM